MQTLPILLPLMISLLKPAFADEPDTVTPALLHRGKEVFLQNCIACHGATGEGNGPAAKVMNPKPRNFISEAFKFGDNPKQIFKTVTTGIEGTSMPSWKDIPEEDRWAVTYYVKSLRKKKPARPQRPQK